VSPAVLESTETTYSVLRNLSTAIKNDIQNTLKTENTLRRTVKAAQQTLCANNVY
jgi:hypothetical protein